MYGIIGVKTNVLFGLIRKISSKPIVLITKITDFYKKVVGFKKSLVGNDLINPAKNVYFYWLAIIAITILYNLVFSLARAAFWQLDDKFYLPWFLIFDIIADCIYLLDIYIKSRTTYIVNGLFIEKASEVAKNYFRNWKKFAFDIFTFLPFDHVFTLLKYNLIIGENFPLGTGPLLRLNRLLKIPKIFQFLDRAETRTHYPNCFRIMELCGYILVIVHTNACIYFGMSRYIGLGSDRWVYPPQGTGWQTNTTLSSKLTEQYVYCLYWSTVVLTAIGEAPTPTRNIEYIFQVLDFLTGVLIFATIVGNVGTMISNATANRTEFTAKVDSVKQYMKLRHVSADLQTKVIKWYDYLWQNEKTVDEEEVLALLPDKLRASVAMNVHLETLKKVKLFENLEPGFLLEVVLRLRPQVFSPGDFVCKKGDIGRDMFIIKEGELEAVSEDLKTRFAILKTGSVLGELSILEIPGSIAGNRRSCNVRSIGYCDLFRLSKEDLTQVLEDYPDAKRKIETKGQEILRKDNMIDESLLDKKKDFSLEKRVENLEAELSKLLGKFISMQEAAFEYKNKLENDIKGRSTVPVLSKWKRVTLRKKSNFRQPRKMSLFGIAKVLHAAKKAKKKVSDSS